MVRIYGITWKITSARQERTKRSKLLTNTARILLVASDTNSPSSKMHEQIKIQNGIISSILSDMGNLTTMIELIYSEQQTMKRAMQPHPPPTVPPLQMRPGSVPTGQPPARYTRPTRPTSVPTKPSPRPHQPRRRAQSDHLPPLVPRPPTAPRPPVGKPSRNMERQILMF